MGVKEKELRILAIFIYSIFWACGAAASESGFSRPLVPLTEADLETISQRATTLEQYVRLLQLNDQQLRCELSRQAQALNRDLLRQDVEALINSLTVQELGNASFYRDGALSMYRSSDVEKFAAGCQQD